MDMTLRMRNKFLQRNISEKLICAQLLQYIGSENGAVMSKFVSHSHLQEV